MTKSHLVAIAALLLFWQAYPRAQPGCGAPTANAQSGVAQTTIQQIKPLPGGLNKVPVLNSNSPEVVESDGILVSTLPPAGRKHPEAHLNFAFRGRFDIFAHHIARGITPGAGPLYIGLVLFNDSRTAVKVDVLQAASYLSQPDAPFVDLPPAEDNTLGAVYSGPGDRVTDDFLHGWTQPGWPSSITVPAHQGKLLMALPIPVVGLAPPLNGRSMLVRLLSHGPVYAATLALSAKSSGAPAEQEWLSLLDENGLAGPREQPPSLPNAAGPAAYGRVAGVAQGDEWKAQVEPIECTTAAPLAVSFPLSTVAGATLGTDQVQSARLLVREPGTAYAAHGNYAVRYKLSVPLVNESAGAKTIAVLLQTPLKKESRDGVVAFAPHPEGKVFFRGTIKYECADASGSTTAGFVHITQHQGEPGTPFVEVTIAPGEKRRLTLSWLYPPDATPPQMLTFTCR